MGSCTQKGIATPYSQLLIFTAVVVFSRISCLEITGIMRPPLNLSFLLLHNEGIFYQGSGELQHFKRFCFEKNIYWNDLPFHAKDDEPHNQSFCYMFMQYIVRFANAKLPLQMQIYQSAPQTCNIFYSIHAVTRVRSNPRTRDVNEVNNWEPRNLFPVV